MEPNEEHVQTLLGMGFSDVSEIRKALRLGRNDVNEAVAILTNEQPGSSYDTLDDVEMKDLQGSSSNTNRSSGGGDPPPPSYDEAVEPVSEEDHAQNGQGKADEDTNVAVPNEFPTTNLYELEGRVFTEQWSIPYKKEESLGKCLLGATRLAEEGMMDTDENCMRFVDRCMPEAFKKLLTSGAVHRWGTDIQEGIYNMLQLLIDFIAARLKYDPAPIGLLGVLGLAFDPETEFHFKNRAKRWDRIRYEDIFGANQSYAVSPPFSTYREPHGWLVNLINRFAEKGGFESCRARMLESTMELDAPLMASLLYPFGVCAEYLNAQKVSPILQAMMENAITYIQGLDENDLRHKKSGSVSDLLSSMKLLCMHLWTPDVTAIDDLRLDIALRMLKSPHFNAKMNSLKELTKLIDDSSATRAVKNAIPSEKILDWLVDHKILSIALEGNIDQSQYCDKIKGIVEFLGSRLSLDELTKIWKMQNGQQATVVDNIHSIMAAAAVKFSAQQLEHLFMLIQKSWQDENDRMREKLLSLIGKIGREARVNKTTTKVLELLWDLSHLPALPTHLIEQALDEHLTILSDSFSVKEQVKKNYVIKSIDDIKKGFWVVPAFRQLYHIARSIVKQTYHKEKGILHELNKNYEVVKLVTQSLVRSHKMAVTAAGENPLTPDTVVDSRYTHREFVSCHLRFLAFILQEGMLYLHWHRARDIWDCLVANPDACEMDRETCFDWFTKGLCDLEAETQQQLFTQKLLKFDPAKLSLRGFACVRTFFENVNLYEHKLRKSAGSAYVVEKLDLYGIEFMWQIALETPNEEIANIAIKHLLHMCYNNLSPRLKKDPVSLHKKFITECYKRLEEAMITLGGSALAIAISRATKTLTAATIPEVASLPSPSRSAKLLIISRLLLLAERYVTMVEDNHPGARTILPHGASFQGQPIVMHCNCETPKGDFTIMGHTNETLRSVRQKISDQLKTSPENVQLATNDKILMPSKDEKLLHQLYFEDEQLLIVKTATISGPMPQNRADEDSLRIEEAGNIEQSRRQSYVLDTEKTLPGVVMAMGGHVFDMLYQLAELDEPKIRSRVRSLLMLIPTDPAVLDSLETVGRSGDDSSSTSDDGSSTPRDTTSKSAMENLFNPAVQGMSAFRVLYNLEVLSGKLMPAVQDMTSFNSKVFCENFLTAGGLNFVVNVLQKDAIPPDVDYETRQGCYSICLQLARFLLCGQSLMGHSPSETALHEDAMETNTNNSASVARSYSSSPSKNPTSVEKNNKELESSSHEIPSAAKLSIQTMSVSDFTATITSFMRLTWAAAAGRIHLASSSQPMGLLKEGAVYAANTFTIGERRSRHSSTGSTGSTCSDQSEIQSLFPGVCAIQQSVSNKDSRIAREALELLVRCLQLRTDLLGSFYTLPCVNDFIIDILLGSPHCDVRNAALEQFDTLSHTQVRKSATEIQKPRFFLLQVLLKAAVPLWTASSNVRGTSKRLLGQCSQYFDLRCRLLHSLSNADQKTLQINCSSMLEDETAWLDNFDPSEQYENIETDEIILTGHLRLLNTLFTCDGIDKKKFSKPLLYNLLNEFLFPASKLILVGSGNEKPTSTLDFVPKCSTVESRIAAFEILVVLANGCLENLQDISDQLLTMHHQPDPSSAKEWEYLPPVAGRPYHHFVGLRNAGATCYMNSVIQQLFMTPGLAEELLSCAVPENPEESVFYQIQRVFGHLRESKLQYHVPEKFWKCFKLWGQPVNVREQQDAFEFFTDLTDQLDEYLKKQNHKELFKPKFQGIFSDQKICKDCPHRYEREEAFFALNLTVKSHNLESSLEQFVRGEILEGDNAYFCEKCGEKRNTIKRLCIKTLPPVLVIQLKRFGYDWEANRALKFDDYFQFPWLLDMEPYTVEGVAKRDAENVENNNEVEEKCNKSFRSSNYDELYQLVGVVVHSGQANAGHYYSFIKDRRGTSITNPTKGKWFKFNDTIVEEFDMNDGSVEAECFGGTYRAKVYDQSSSYPETRQRYWNGYMLFYEKTEGTRTPEPSLKRPPSRATRAALLKHDSEGDIQVVSEHSSPESSPRHDSDGLSMLTALVRKGEKRGIFLDQMPASIQQEIRDENLRFVKNKGVHNVEYFKFVRQLVSCNSRNKHLSHFDEVEVTSLRIAVQFLFNTYFRTKKKLRLEIGEWCSTIETIVSQSKKACFWLIDYIASKQGSIYIKPFLLECPTKEVREAFSKILESTLKWFFNHGGNAQVKTFDDLVEILVAMLEKDVPDNCKTCTQYFWLLDMYVHMGLKACQHLFARNAFQRLLMFLLGPMPVTSRRDMSHEDLMRRRWTSLQTRDFGLLHSTLAILVLHCDISSQRTTDAGECTFKSPHSIRQPQTLIPLPMEVKIRLFQHDTIRYVREAVLACREVSGSTTAIEDVLLYCSFCNESFSIAVLMMIKSQVNVVPANELKSVLGLLLELLLLDDPLQLTRLKWTIDGTNNDGLLSIIRSSNVNDSRRAYQCIKFLVNLANRCTVAKEYLMAASSRWQWAVNWLKKKMTEYYWSPHSSASNESASGKSFQRTVSAQDTLAEATALLTELESQENAAAGTMPDSTMEENGTEDTQIDDDVDTEVQNDTNNESIGDLDDIDS
ncbi:ubiquitin carboxyl-terminal hydrolase 24-like isoform X2 [Ptychodera flava]|uniref:ubiquitin carboxyl-terminal hydrolase 24-like isoform X2 n=1 Tax=Ptychodera flava TaxID=63121 RepID=UPI003969D98D